MNKLSYGIIINIITNYYVNNNIRTSIKSKDMELRYLILLFIKKYCYIDNNILMEMMNIKSRKTVSENLKMAEKILLYNREFREKYYTLQDYLNKII